MTTPDDHAPQPAPDPARVQVELASRVAGITRLADLGAPVSRMVDIQPVLADVLRTVVDLMRAPFGSLMLYDAVTDQISVVATIGLGPTYADDLGRLRPGEGAAGVSLESRQPVLVEDVTTDPIFERWRQTAARHGYRSMCVVPLVTLADEVMGVLVAYWREPHRPSDRDVELADTYARHAADLVARARLHGEARDLASRERRRGEQLRQLADTALLLSSAREVDELLKTVTEAAREIIGAHQAVTSRLYRGWEQAATHVSLSGKYAAWRDYTAVPKGLGVLNVVTRENRPLRLTAEELENHPEFHGLRDAPGHPPLRSYLGAPLVGADGNNLGLIQLSDKADGEFTAEDEAILVQLAQMTSAATERLELLASERAARAAAERLAAQHRQLSDATKLFASSLELGDAFRAVVRTVLPDFAQWCAIDLLDADGTTVRRIHARGVASEVEAQMRRLHPTDVLDSDSPYGSVAVIRSGESARYADVDDDAITAYHPDPVLVADLRRSGIRSAVVVPMRARGRVIGALTLVRFGGSAYTGDDLSFAEELSARAALAIDNARRYAFERGVAGSLQQSLLPRALPIVPGIDVASRYLPGASGTEVGGDWYDLIDLGQGRYALVVGDVMGRGIEAASVMGQLRAAVRAYALEGHEPAELLRRLDRVVQALGDSQLTTCIYGVYDASSRDLTLATAGHLPPLVIGDGGPHFLELEPGVPLGVGHAQFGQSRVPLAAGTTVLLYTDGLIEGRDCTIGEGMLRLLEAARSAPHNPEELCDHVLHALGRDGDHDDDTALLALTLVSARTGDPHEPAELDLPNEPGSAAAARSFVAGSLRARGLDRHRDVAVLLVSELVTNALRHARTAVRVRLATTEDRVRVEVVDGSGQVPLPRHAVPDQDESGRGLVLVAGLSDRWGAEPGFGGKCVWFELDV